MLAPVETLRRAVTRGSDSGLVQTGGPNAPRDGSRRHEEGRLRLHLGREAPEVGNLGAYTARMVVFSHVGRYSGFQAADVRGRQPLGLGPLCRQERRSWQDLGLKQQGPCIPAGDERVIE